MQKDSADYALIRLLVNQTDKAIDLLSKGGYIFDIMPVIALCGARGLSECVRWVAARRDRSKAEAL